MASVERRVLLLDGNGERASRLDRKLRYLNYEPITAAAQIEDEPASIAVVVGDTSGDAQLSATAIRLRETHPELPFLCLTAEARNLGGPSWDLKLPLTRSQLSRLLSRAERYRGVERRHRLTGTSHPIRRVRTLIEQVADFDTTVLVNGESGTGKELVARTIHDLSARSARPFVPVNCGAIPAELLESELFGHEKGAFTGAIQSRHGRFEMAEGGTLFLDEIGEMSLDMQVKLLRVLQERSFERIGSNKTVQCDVRIVAATHVDLPAAVGRGEFREDLYYRLNVFPITMPPLYKRASDLPALLDELLVTQTGADKGTLRMSEAAIRVLANYRWPGNVRELSNLVERLAILKPQGIIDVEDLPEKYLSPDPALVTQQNSVSEAMQMTAENLKDHLQRVERDLIDQAMQVSDGVVARAARLLSMRRTTLVEKINRYHI